MQLAHYCRKFLGLPPACGAAPGAADSDTAAHDTAPSPPDCRRTAAAQDAQLSMAHGQQDQGPVAAGARAPPPPKVRVLNPPPPGGEAAPAPAARMLPAATLEALYSRLPHYASSADLTRK